MKSCLFVGIDTHKDSHTAAVLDGYFEVVATISFTNSSSGFTGFEEKLKKLRNGKDLIFGLEDSQGLGSFLASYLIGKGYKALEINPITTDRGRKHTVSRDKSDERDAVVIAKTLIRERSNLHPVRIDRNGVALREMAGYRQMLIGESTRIKNRLHMMLFNQYKRVLSCFKDPFGKCALAFFLRYPDPFSLKEADPNSLSDFLKTNSKGMFSGEKARAILSSTGNNIADSLTDTRAHIIASHIERLLGIQEELKKTQDMLKDLVIASSYHCLTSIPGIDIITAARIISAVMDISRFSSASKLARFCGIAPSERSTGRKKRYVKSKHGNKSLRSTIYFVALSHISRTRDGRDKNPISRAYYLKKVSEGKTKKEALTCLTRRLVDIIFAIMRDRSIYNFSKSRFTKHHDSLINTVAA
ncbi:IS110 family transposase ISCth14 [subsurface metagenome]